MPRWTGWIPNRFPKRDDERHDDEDGRIDVHEAADDEQGHVEEQQEHVLRRDRRRHPGAELLRDLGVDDVVG